MKKPLHRLRPEQAMRAMVKILMLALLLPFCDVWAEQTVTGRWEYHGPAESGIWLKTAQNKNSVSFELEIARGAPSYNSGWIRGELELHAGVGEFKKATESGMCEIRFHFQAKRVELKQMGDHFGCGFGHNVFAIGVLKRVSHQKPDFCAGDPRTGGCADVWR